MGASSRIVIVAFAASLWTALACGADGGTAGPGEGDVAEDPASSADGAVGDTRAAEAGAHDTVGDADADLGVSSVSGHAFVFGPPGGRIVGATVTVLEQPDFVTTTAEDGSWSLSVPNGRPATFVLEHPDHAPYQTATLDIAGDMERVTFQAPTWDMVDLLAGMADVERDPERCQIAATVTRRGHSLYDSDGLSHGEPGATVTIAPPPPDADGPIYFNLVMAQVIYPDRALEATSEDGGVLFLNVTPGEYVLSASKEGATVADSRIVCRPGWIANASPPWGLQVLEGGLEPRPE